MAFSKNRHVDKKLSLMRVIGPVNLVMSLFGLLSYSLKSTRNGGVVINTKSIYFNSLRGVSVLILIYTFFVLHVHDVFTATESNTMTKNVLTKLNYMIELTNFLVFCTVAYICAFRNRFTYAKLLNAIASSCNNFPDLIKNTIFRDLQGHVRLIMCLLCLYSVMQLAVNFSRNNSVWKMILVALTFNLPQIIQSAVISFYCVLLFALSTILKNIDANIRDIANVKTMFSGCLKLEMIPFSLRQLEVVYVKVLEIKREINRALEACLLVIIFQCFHAMVSEAYIIFDGLTINAAFDTHNICNCSIWVIYQVMKIYAITYPGTLLKEEQNKISCSLYNIPVAQQDTRLFLEIQHFSTLMSHQTTELSVYGHFVLDAQLMFNIIASASIYLTILLNFEKQS
ncbi:uncharacterized protein [Choristoneura fumiferana]|uniref:uncharacterized protein n=1 Tax=Choristoneura fumiferana TaxID=7141 RepID=UPI003D1595DF